MQYIIDYRTGGMGNTIVSHIMYSCDKWQLDLTRFFSKTGDAHAAISKYANSILIPLHMHEHPELIPSNSTCILEIKTSVWFKLLETKMAYSKWIGKKPTMDNVLEFFNIEHQQVLDKQKLWAEFYDNIKDPTWPECESFADVENLPSPIRDEIYSTYKPPEVEITESNWWNLLTIAYYDNLQQSKDLRSSFGGHPYLLDNYFVNDLTIVKNIIQTQFGWVWNDEKSDAFNRAAMEANQPYINWLKYMQSLHDKTINGQLEQIELEAWEKALLLAKICVYYSIDPKDLQWDNINDLNTNQTLIEHFKD